MHSGHFYHLNWLTKHILSQLTNNKQTGRVRQFQLLIGRSLEGKRGQDRAVLRVKAGAKDWPWQGGGW